MAIASVAGAALLAGRRGADRAAPTCGSPTRTRRPTRPPSTVEAFSGPPQVFARRPGREPGLGRGDLGDPRRAREPAGEDAVPGPRDPRAGDRRPRLAGFRAGCGWGSASGSASPGPACSRSASRRTAGCLWPVPDRLRAAAGVGRDPHARAGWSTFSTPGTGAARGRRRAVARLAGAAAPGRRDSRRGRRRSAPSRWLALAIAVEGRGLPFDPTDSLAQPAVPPAPRSTSRSVPAPQLHLPAERATDNRRYLFWSTDGFPEIVNGRSSVQPEYTQAADRRDGDLPRRDTRRAAARLGDRQRRSCTPTGSAAPPRRARRRGRSPASGSAATASASWSSTSSVAERQLRPGRRRGRRPLIGASASGRGAPAARSRRAAPRPRSGQRSRAAVERGHRVAGDRRARSRRRRSRPRGHRPRSRRSRDRRQRAGSPGPRTRSRATAAAPGGHDREPGWDRRRATVEHGVLERPVAEQLDPARRCPARRAAGR